MLVDGAMVAIHSISYAPQLGGGGMEGREGVEEGRAEGIEGGEGGIRMTHCLGPKRCTFGYYYILGIL